MNRAPSQRETAEQRWLSRRGEHDEAEFDVIVVGGGASGLAAAITAARAGVRVGVIERDVALGLSILATGNGRCNLSNSKLDVARYAHPEAVRAVMGTAPERELDAFFTSVGIMTTQVEGRLYPFSKRAESVRFALLDAAGRAGVEPMSARELASAECDQGSHGWMLAARTPAEPIMPKPGHDLKRELRRARRALSAAHLVDEHLRARRVVIAVGGASARVAGIFGLPHREEHPVLCPIACDMPGAAGTRASLDGLRVDAALTCLRAGTPLARETGEVLFRRYGISGIAAFNLSRRVAAGDVIELDLFAHLDEEALSALLTKREAVKGSFRRADESWFDGMLARPLAALVLTDAGATTASCAHACKHVTLTVTGLADQRCAQIRRGGIPVDAIELPDLNIRRQIASDAFACGEALDVDADCGGYNLAWAWLSGLRAGAAAARAAQSD